MNYLEALNWRYSVKKFDGNQIPKEIIDNILEAGRLSVSSLGLQPYYLLVINNKEKIKSLTDAFYNTNQISTCSHLVVLVSKKQIDPNYIDSYFNHIATEREITIDQLSSFRKNIDDFITNSLDNDLSNWTDKQAYIVLGTMIMAAAQEKIDTCPMEGYKLNY